MKILFDRLFVSFLLTCMVIVLVLITINRPESKVTMVDTVFVPAFCVTLTILNALVTWSAIPIFEGRLKESIICDFMGWHSATAEGSDGCSFTSTCDRCGKRVLQDSQGNWFESSNQ